jgi:hypothetical protein
MNGSFFNTDRMLGQYFSNAYFPQAPTTDESPRGEATHGEVLVPMPASLVASR